MEAEWVTYSFTKISILFQVKAVLNEGKKTFNVTYIPQVMGMHKVRKGHQAFLLI